MGVDREYMFCVPFLPNEENYEKQTDLSVYSYLEDITIKEKTAQGVLVLSYSCASDGTRTRDPLRDRQVR